MVKKRKPISPTAKRKLRPAGGCPSPVKTQAQAQANTIITLTRAAYDELVAERNKYRRIAFRLEQAFITDERHGTYRSEYLARKLDVEIRRAARGIKGGALLYVTLSRLDRATTGVTQVPATPRGPTVPQIPATSQTSATPQTSAIPQTSATPQTPVTQKTAATQDEAHIRTSLTRLLVSCLPEPHRVGLLGPWEWLAILSADGNPWPSEDELGLTLHNALGPAAPDWQVSVSLRRDLAGLGGSDAALALLRGR